MNTTERTCYPITHEGFLECNTVYDDEARISFPLSYSFPKEIFMTIERELSLDALKNFFMASKIINVCKAPVFWGNYRLISEILMKAEYQFERISPSWRIAIEKVSKSIYQLNFSNRKIESPSKKALFEKIVSILNQFPNVFAANKCTLKIEGYAQNSTFNMNQKGLHLIYKDDRTENELSSLVLAKNWKALEILFCDKIEDKTFDAIVQNTSLKSLRFDMCKGLTDANILRFQPMKNLTSLKLNDCWGLSAQVVHPLKNFRQLQTLSFEDLAIEDIHLEKFLTLTSLKKLSLNYCNHLSSDATTILIHFTGLQVLNVARCKWVCNELLENLFHLKKLQSLNLTGCENISNTGISHLKVLSELEILRLDSCPGISGAIFSDLQHSTTLKILHLFGCKTIFGKDVASLALCTSLQELDLRESFIFSNSTSQQLTSLTNLSCLHISQNQMSVEDEEDLSKKMAQLSIIKKN